MVRHRDGANGWSDRLVTAMRVFNGQYDAQKLQEIRRFGGSEIYARLIATKCRGATSLLRDVYLNAEKPWGLKPTPDPTLPDDIAGDDQPAGPGRGRHDDAAARPAARPASRSATASPR